MRYLLIYILITLIVNKLNSQVIILQPNDSTICENSNVAFNIETDNINNYGFQWQYDSAGTNNWTNMLYDTTKIILLQNVPIIYNNYKFRCIVDTNGIPLDTSSLATLTIIQYSNAGIIPDSINVCKGDFTEITLSSQIGSIQWQVSTDTINWNDIQGAVNTTCNTSIINNDIYYRVIVKNGICPIDTSNISYIIAKQLPIADFTSNTVCFGDSTVFTNLSTGGISWYWNFNDNAIFDGFDTTHVFSHSGNFNVSLIITTYFGCIDTVTNQVTVFPSPQVNFNITDRCLNDTTKFTNFTTSADTYLWNFGDSGTTSTVPNPVHLYQTIGDFVVTLTAYNSYNCIDSLIDTAKVYPLPIAGFIADTVCFGFQTSFTDTSTLSVAWNWNYNNNGTTSIEQNPEYIFNITDTFNVHLIVTSINGCKDTTKKDVFVYPLPQINLSSSVVCYKDTTQFTNSTTGAISYLWDFGDNSSPSNIENPKYLYTQSGNYNVELLAITNKGCADSITQNVTVNSLPAPFISGTAQICANESGMIYTTPYVVGNSYQWTVNNGVIEGGQGFEAVTIHWDSIPDTTATLAVTETIDNTGCYLTTPHYNVTLSDKYAPDKAKIQLKGIHILVCMDFNVDSWQWYYDGSPILGETEHYYPANASATGDYWCVTSFQNGCDTESEHFNFLTMGIEDNYFANSIKIYPNPSNGVFYVEMENEYYGDISIILSNVLGESIQQFTFKKNNLIFSQSIKKELQKGVYYVSIYYNNNKVKFLKLIKI